VAGVEASMRTTATTTLQTTCAAKTDAPASNPPPVVIVHGLPVMVPTLSTARKTRRQDSILSTTDARYSYMKFDKTIK
jgi:hypothetical protein